MFVQSRVVARLLQRLNFEFFPMECGPIQKKLILTFEANSASSPKLHFFRISSLDRGGMGWELGRSSLHYFSGREFRKQKNRSGEAWSDFPPDLLTLLLLDTVPVGRYICVVGDSKSRRGFWCLMGCNSKQNDGGMLLHRVSDLCRQDCFHVSRSKDLMDLCKVQLVHIFPPVYRNKRKTHIFFHFEQP